MSALRGGSRASYVHVTDATGGRGGYPWITSTGEEPHGWKHCALRNQREGRKSREAFLQLALRMEVRGLGDTWHGVLPHRRRESGRRHKPEYGGAGAGRLLRHRRHQRLDRQGPRAWRQSRRQDGNPGPGLVRGMRRHRGQQVLSLSERSERHDGDRAADRPRLRPGEAAGTPRSRRRSVVPAVFSTAARWLAILPP